jgi:hypothetical protein
MKVKDLENKLRDLNCPMAPILEQFHEIVHETVSLQDEDDIRSESATVTGLTPAEKNPDKRRVIVLLAYVNKENVEKFLFDLDAAVKKHFKADNEEVLQ